MSSNETKQLSLWDEPQYNPDNAVPKVKTPRKAPQKDPYYSPPMWDMEDRAETSGLHGMYLEPTDSGYIQNYNPVSYNKLRSTLEDSKVPVVEYSTYINDVNKSFKDIITESLRDDTLVVFPTHFSVKFGWDNSRYSQRHKGLFSHVMCCLKNREGERPRILCLADTYTENRDTETGEWVESRANGVKVFSSKKDHLEHVMQSSDRPYYAIPLEDEEVQAAHLKAAADGIKYWLRSHPEIKNIIFPVPALASLLFDDPTLPQSLKAGAYQVFTGTIEFRIEGVQESRTYSFGYIPNLLNHIKYEDKCFDLSADMMSIVMNPKPKKRIRKKIIRTVKDARKVADYYVNKKKPLSIDLETTGKNPVYRGQKIISASVSDGRRAWVFLVDHPKHPEYTEGMNMLKCFFGRKELMLILQNAVYDFKWYYHMTGEYPSCQVRDTMLLDHWLYEGQGSIGQSDSDTGAHNMGLGFGYSMDCQIPRYLRFPSHKNQLDKALEGLPKRNPYKDPGGRERNAMTYVQARELVAERMSDDWMEPNSGQYAELPLRTLLTYNGDDSGYTMLIYLEQCKRIDKECGGRDNWPTVITDLMPKMIRNTVEMELNGAPVNYDEILDKIREVSVSMIHLKNEVEAATGKAFNLDSPEQLKKHLFKVEGVDPDTLYNVKKGKASTDIEVLSRLKDSVQWMDTYLSYKKAHKLKNTYLIPILLKSYKGVLYFGIKLTGTATGRLSSWNPNIQNLPKHLKISGKKTGLKEVIQAPKGKIFIDMDLSSAEVKVLTVVCPDPTLVDVLKKGLDPHSYTAHLVSRTADIQLSYDEVLAAHEKSDTDAALTAHEQHCVNSRQNAKRVTFGSIYRIGKRGLASQLKFPFEQRPKERYKSSLLRKQEEGEMLGEELLGTLFNKVYPDLPGVFTAKDTEVFERHYGESLFGRRRRYAHTNIPVVHEILVRSQLYRSGDSESPFDIKECLGLISSKRSFRQNLNFEVQSPTSDYMQYFIAYILEECAAKGIDCTAHLTVHDSVLFSIPENPEVFNKFKAVCDKGMNEYLMSLSDKLPVVIGYGYKASKKYCQITAAVA